MKRKLIVMVFLFLSGSYLFAQEAETKSNFSTNIGVVNRFVWRGIFLDSKPNIQPSLVYSKSGFTAGAWGSYNLISGYAQTNFFGSYSTNGLTLQLMDHYIGDDATDVDYFDYSNETTSHNIEASIQYKIKGISVLASTFFYGADKNTEGDNRYSSYAELGYSKKVKDVNFDFFVGTSLNEGVYADDFAVVSAGVKASRTIKITESFSLPVGFTIAANPDQKKMYFIIDISIN